MIVKCPTPAIKLPKIVGVDDWAFKKRLKYGTIIVDLETNEVINLLTAGGVPHREALTLTNWLKKHSSVEIVSRDRSSTYASGITQASDKIIQIVDRWHILKNLTEGFERVSGGVPLNTQRGSLRDISVELSQKQQPELENVVPIPPVIAKKDTSITGKYYDNLRIVAPSQD